MDPKARKPENRSAPGGSNQPGELPPDVSTIVREAESIARGEDPSAAAGNDSGPSTAGKDGDGTRAPAPDSPPSVTDADRRIARRIVAATDQAFIKYFGPGAGFEAIEREIAIEDWSEIAAHYMPQVLSGSPGLRLVVLYIGHIGVLFLGAEWMHDAPTSTQPDPLHRNGSSPDTSGAADREKPS